MLVYMTILTSNQTTKLLNMEDGCYIVQIVKEWSCRIKPELKQNDRIIRFDGEKIQSTSDVKAILKKHKIGDNVKMVVDRDSKEIEVEIVLQAQTQAN